MTNEAQALDLGRRFDHIVRARRFLGIAHFIFGLIALFLANAYLMANRWDDWWFAPIRALHLRRMPLLSPPWFIATFVLFLPPLPYVASWRRIRETVLEDLTGARFWIAVISYSLCLFATSALSDWLWIEAISPPLHFWGIVAIALATHIGLRLSSNIVESAFGGRRFFSW